MLLSITLPDNRRWNGRLFNIFLRKWTRPIFIGSILPEFTIVFMPPSCAGRAILKKFFLEINHKLLQSLFGQPQQSFSLNFEGSTETGLDFTFIDDLGKAGDG